MGESEDDSQRRQEGEDEAQEHVLVQGVALEVHAQHREDQAGDEEEAVLHCAPAWQGRQAGRGQIVTGHGCCEGVVVVAPEAAIAIAVAPETTPSGGSIAAPVASGCRDSRLEGGLLALRDGPAGDAGPR